MVSKPFVQGIFTFLIGIGMYSLGVFLSPVHAVELKWHTFLGGAGTDYGYGISIDASGNCFVSGRSTTTWGSPIRAYTSGVDAFVAKLDSAGNLLWHTFLGGNGSDIGLGMRVDNSGNSLLTGHSDATWGSPVRAFTSGNDAFVVKLDSAGNLLWITFLGGDGIEYGYDIAIDSLDNNIVVGRSSATWETPIRAYTSGIDAFVAKLDSSGNLLWNTFLGGNGSDYLMKIGIDALGNSTGAGYGDATWGLPVRVYTSGVDAIVAKLDSSGNLVWNTFLGGSGNDYAYGVSLDSSGNSIISGLSYTSWGSPIRAYTSGTDATVAKLDSSGNLVWNTFLGGSGNDGGNNTQVDNSGNPIVVGESYASWGTPLLPYSSGDDAFVAKFDSLGNLLWHIFFGGSGTDRGYSISSDTSRNIFIIGSSNATWGNPIRAYTGDYDAFIAMIQDDPPISPPGINLPQSLVDTPTCTTPPPGTPDLFRIDVADTDAVLYYSPFPSNNSNYNISYSTSPDKYQYGVETGQGTATGVLSFPIHLLSPDTDYYFQIRGQNGCRPGTFSSLFKVHTRPRGNTTFVTKTRYGEAGENIQYPMSNIKYPIEETEESPKNQSSNDKSNPNDQMAKENSSLEHSDLTPSPTPSPLGTRNSSLGTSRKQYCFLWWCW